MATKSKRAKQLQAKNARKSTRARRPRALNQHDPRVRAELQREGKLLAQHPENAAIDAWIDAVYDWSEWK